MLVAISLSSYTHLMKQTKKDKSIHVAQREKLNFDLTIQEFPWSERQKEFLRIAQDKNTKIMFCAGPAGSSKSLLAAYVGLQALKDKKSGQIVYVRQPVESSKFTLGYLKGDMNEKMGPYLAPLQDKLEELVPKSQVEKLKIDERLVGMPVGHLRGRTFNVSTIIADEAQNFMVDDLLTLTTRLGKFSKLFICGDFMQSDIKNSGFQIIYNLFNDEESREKGIQTFQFGTEDIFRNEILSYVIDKFGTLQV